jgi:hypothetical protein
MEQALNKECWIMKHYSMNRHAVKEGGEKHLRQKEQYARWLRKGGTGQGREV